MLIPGREAKSASPELPPKTTAIFDRKDAIEEAAGKANNEPPPVVSTGWRPDMVLTACCW
jgi:hypothetical protein